MIESVAPLSNSSKRAIDELAATIQQRRSAPECDSYTRRLLDAGVGKIGEKVIEEAAEVVEAAREPGNPGREHTIREAADLVYHLMVLLASRDAEFSDVESELSRRFGVSGLDEKASRKH